jgi:hypothetical protein
MRWKIGEEKVEKQIPGAVVELLWSQTYINSSVLVGTLGVFLTKIGHPQELHNCPIVTRQVRWDKLEQAEHSTHLSWYSAHEG